MKKQLLAMILALTLLFSSVALAEKVILPDPEFYFNMGYTDEGIIGFDEYPLAEYKAYSALLQEAYGMEIVEEEVSERYEWVYLEAPGVENSLTLVGCFTISKGSGLGFEFGESIILSPLDTYNTSNSSATGEIAWDDGRMIADPGDFLGYEIKVTNICDMTFFDYGGNYFERDYEEIDAYDIWEYIDALENSPYFEICGTYDANYASYKQIFFEYVGPDAEVIASCEEGRRGSKRECDLYIQIHYRDQDRSTFRIVTFPEFTVNSEDYVEPQPTPDDPSIFETCNVCYGDGDCNYCWGRGYHWNDRNQDCSVCRGTGDCYSCGGKGRK